MPDPDPNTAPATPWHAGADPAVLGVLQARGIADKTPLEAVANLVEAHVNAEKLIGAPANELIRWPKDNNDTANLQALRARLGVPTDAKDYDFSGVKFKDGTELDPTFSDFMRGAAHSLAIPKDAATQLAAKFTEYLEGQEAADTTERSARAATEAQALKTSWGANYDANRIAALNVAASMLQKSGMKQEDAAAAINALEGQVGGAKVMEMFRAFSRMAAEDSFVDTGPAGHREVMSYESALATKQGLMRDEGFVQRWNRGDLEAMKQLDALDRIIVASKPEDDEVAFRRQVAEQYARR